MKWCTFTETLLILANRHLSTQINILEIYARNFQIKSFSQNVYESIYCTNKHKKAILRNVVCLLLGLISLTAGLILTGF